MVMIIERRIVAINGSNPRRSLVRQMTRRIAMMTAMALGR